MKKKENYLSPETEVMTFQDEGIICASKVDRNNLGISYYDPFSDEEEDI